MNRWGRPGVEKEMNSVGLSAEFDVEGKKMWWHGAVLGLATSVTPCPWWKGVLAGVGS
jgi:hypothetical protein